MSYILNQIVGYVILILAAIPLIFIRCINNIIKCILGDKNKIYVYIDRNIDGAIGRFMYRVMMGLGWRG